MRSQGKVGNAKAAALKICDIVVADKDITKGAVTDIAKASVLLTLIDCAPVYEGEDLPEPSK